MGKPEVGKEKIVSERLESEHKRKMEREESRHKHLMEEIQALKKAGIKVFVRGFYDVYTNKQLKEIK